MPHRDEIPDKPHLSPCVGVCVFEQKSRYCYGCTRTLPEIAQWGRKTDAEKYTMLRDRKRRQQIIETNTQ
ncbi:MAG: DUF1289 domain-containing protein [Alphaproteobacteria bacterium]|nr:DUF1289 domain-containing protein [Alphaproteobacteria bacterium]